MAKQRVARSQVLRTALENVPREHWGESGTVARAYLECPKLQGILKHLGFKMRVPESLYADIMQNAWFILARQFPTLDEPKNVYSFLYAVLHKTIQSQQASSHRTEHLRTEEEENEEELAVKPMADFDHGMQPDHAVQVINDVDLAKAQKRFSEKLAKYEWPIDIIKDEKLYGRVGRPRKGDTPNEKE